MLLGTLTSKDNKNFIEASRLLEGAENTEFGRAMITAVGYWGEGDFDSCLLAMIPQFAVNNPRSADEEKALEIMLAEARANIGSTVEGFFAIADAKLSVWCAQNIAISKHLPFAALVRPNEAAFFFNDDIVCVNGRNKRLFSDTAVLGYDKVVIGETGYVTVGKGGFEQAEMDPVMYARLVDKLRMRG